jgi:hypothetical protein
MHWFRMPPENTNLLPKQLSDGDASNLLSRHFFELSRFGFFGSN